MELFVSDLDGTLLNENAEISEYTANSLNALIKNGLNFTIATARTIATVRKIIGGIELSIPMILMNGVLIYDPVHHKYDLTNKLSYDLKNTVIAKMRELELSAFMYTIAENEMLTYYEKLTNKAMESFYQQRKFKYYKAFENTDDFMGISDDVIYFTFIDSKEKLAPMCEALKEIDGLELTYYNDIYSDEMWYLEVFSSYASKENGIKYLRSKYGYDKITVFGDNTNDLPMFKASDVRIAVKNANQAVLDKCDKVIAANTENGVVKYLEEIFNG